MGYAFFVVMLFLTFFMIPFSSAASEGAAEGLRLFVLSVLPSLFPYMVCANYLIGTAPKPRLKCGSRLLFSVFAYLITALCGTPSAALLMKKEYDAGGLSRKSASALCAALNQAGPVFILSAFSGAMLGRRELAICFFVCCYSPALIFTIVYGLFTKRGPASGAEVDAPMRVEPLKRFSDSIRDSVLAALRVGGTIVFFRTAISIVTAAGAFNGFPETAKGLAAGLFEMTNGLSMLAHTDRLSLTLCAFVLSFGGASLFIQSKMLFPELSAGRYFAVKAVIGFSSALTMFLLLPEADIAAEAMSDLSESFGAASSGIKTRFAATAGALLSGGFSAALSLIYSKLITANRKGIPA